MLAVLANARFSRLVSVDDIFLPAWVWAEKKFKLKRLMQLSWCHWCSGVWTSGLIFTPAALAGLTVTGIWPSWWIALAMWIPLSLAVAYLSSRLIDSEGGSNGSAT